MFGVSSKLKSSKYLSHIWILEIRSGICLLERQYAANTIDADLVSGFLTAMRNFGEEIAHSLMEEISFQNMKFAITLGKYVMVVCGLNENAPKGGAKGLLNIITFEFEHQYQDKLSQFMGNCTIFLPFGDFLDKFLNRQPKTQEKRINQVEIVEKERKKDPEAKKKKDALINGFTSKMQRRQKGTWLTNYIRRRVKEEFEHEIENRMKSLVRIHQNRDKMRHERHLAIELQTRMMQDIVNKEMQYLGTFPLNRIQNLVGIREYEDHKKQIKFNQKLINAEKVRKKQIQKINAKIRILEDKLKQLNESN